jgi:hypothetical protein
MFSLFIVIAIPLLFYPASNQVKIAEGSSSSTSTSKIYLPFIARSYSTSKGINGRVTFNGAAAAGVPLQLRFYNGSAWSTYATKTTASDGAYSFTGVASLSNGQKYYVRFQNSTSGPDTQLWYWGTRVLTSYSAGCDVGIGDFDIANAPQVSPPSGATVALPCKFQWTVRSAMPSDLYAFELFQPGGTAYWSTQPSYVNGLILTYLPAGFSPGIQYGWQVGIYSPDGGYGYSYYHYLVTFSSTGSGSPRMSTDQTSHDLMEGTFPNPSQ